jgi:NitT/TauT family transport system substrate-binding protein
MHGFAWERLKGRRVLVNQDTQPLAMFKYACARSGLEFADIGVTPAGTEGSAMAAFARGDADFVHLQGPAAQQLARTGAGKVVAAVGDAVGPCAFSSLAATRGWIESDVARHFTRAYRRALQWAVETPAEEIAAVEARYFKDVEHAPLLDAIVAYKALGTWLPDPEITRDAYDATQDIFRHAGLVRERYAYDDVVATPPAWR